MVAAGRRILGCPSWHFVDDVGVLVLGDNNSQASQGVIFKEVGWELAPDKHKERNGVGQHGPAQNKA